MAEDHPFQRYRLWKRTWPFALALAIAYAAIPFEEVSRVWAVAVAGGLGLLLVPAVALVPWERLPRRAATLPPLSIVAIAFLLRYGTGGLADPVDFEALLILPVFWFALYGTRREVVVTVALGGATYGLSLGLADDVSDEWLKAILWPTIAALVGLRVQGLVEQAQRLSRTDALTETANRGRWEEELRRESAQARRAGTPLAVALLDLDHFKRINDERGHRAGDELLRRCADNWTAELREGDLLGRYGGEEFAVLLPQTGARDAREVAERLRRAMPKEATCSVGVAVLRDGEAAQDAVQRADEALYAAKERGRDRVELAP